MDRTLLTSVAIMALGMLMIPLGDTAGKLMISGGAEPIFVAWTRYGFGALMLLPFAFHRNLGSLLINWRIWLRSVFQAATIVSILTALSSEPIANVFGAFFVGPVVSYALSVWLLKEQGNTTRAILLLLGFVGVMLVVKPGFGMTAGIGWAVLAGTLYGLFLTASRWVAPLGRPVYLLMTQLIVGTLVLTPFAVTNIPEITPTVSGLVLWSALASMLGNLGLVWAYRRASASVLAPFVYVQLIGAAAYGWLFFDTWPDLTAAIGLAIIFASGFATLFLRRA